MATLAVYPGSFDPLTNGHVDIISRGAKLFDRIIVAILVNAEKAPMFTMAERVEIAREVFKTHPKVAEILAGGKLLKYGAKTINAGGYWTMPKLFADGVSSSSIIVAAPLLSITASASRPRSSSPSSARRLKSTS